MALWCPVSPSRRPVTAFDREVARERLSGGSFDLLVVGGGITGAGVALDASARGLRTALVERGDFASGTSSKSSKLVHGGLRYLQQREFALVHESLNERHRLLRNAPHLVEPLTFLIPLFGRGGVVDATVARAYSTALWMYDAAGGWKIGKRHRRISAEEIARHFPTLRTDRLVAGFVYYDARTDDARLTLAVLRTAVLDHGAVALNHAPVVGLDHDANGQVCGARVAPVGLPVSGAQLGCTERPDSGPAEIEIELGASVVVNATGVWSDSLCLLDDPVHATSIRPAKGIHLTVRRDKLPCDMAGVIPVSKDHRSIFVVPWGDHTYLGTTDTDYSGPVDDPKVERADVAYVLDAVNAAVTSPIGPEDVTAAWAGLRPLLVSESSGKKKTSARTADLSRRHQVHTSRSGLVSITGGKMTTYRQMASDTVDAVQERLGRKKSPCPTKHMALRGSAGLPALRRPGRAAALGVDEELFAHLVSRYGGEAAVVLALADGEPGLSARLAEGLPHIGAEVVYAARYEMAACVEDVLARRTRMLLEDADATLVAAGSTARILAGELGWDETRLSAEVARLGALVRHDLEAPREMAFDATPASSSPTSARAKATP